MTVLDPSFKLKVPWYPQNPPTVQDSEPSAALMAAWGGKWIG